MTIPDLIATRREEIVARWRERVRGPVVSPALRTPEIVNSLPLFLDHLVEALRAGRAIEAATLGAAHGAQRLHTGFDIGAVLREYEIVREVLLEVILGTENAVLSHEEWSRVVKSLFVAAEGAAAEYVRARDEAARRLEAQHFGFLAHELRTPLGSALMALTLLERRGEVPRESRALAVLSRALTDLRHLVDESLAHSRLRGTATLRLDRLALPAFVAGIESELALHAAARRQRLEVDVAPVEIEADRLVLRSAVTNLLTNAIKFSGEGETIRVRASAGEGRVTIEVEDRCGGLPPGKAESLFDPYVQAGEDRSGFGLGLAIVKQAADAHGGAARVHDLPGRGCVFALSLPLEQPRAAEQPAGAGGGAPAS